MMRALAILAAVLAGPSSAEGLPPLAAVGAIEKDGKRSCTAVLVAPDRLATAAHCVLGLNDAADRDDADAPTFHTGAYPAHPSGSAQLAEVLLHPFYRVRSAAMGGSVGTDIAVVRLNAPIPAEVARPIPPGAPVLGGERLVIAGWPGGTGKRARERVCPALTADGTVAQFSCIVVPGESGGAVLRLTETGPELAAIVVATGKDGRQPFGFAVQARDRLRQIEAIYGR